MQLITFLLESIGVTLALFDTYNKNLIERLNQGIDRTKSEFRNSVPAKDYSLMGLGTKIEILIILSIYPVFITWWLWTLYQEVTIYVFLVFLCFSTIPYLGFQMFIFGRFYRRFFPDVLFTIYEVLSRRNYLSFFGLSIAIIGLILELISFYR